MRRLRELFVGVLGASGLIYAEATRSQDLASWVSAHVRMLEYVGGSPAIWVGVHVTWRVPKSRIARPRRRRTEDNRHVTSSTSG